MVADHILDGTEVSWTVGFEVPEEFSIMENVYFIDRSNVAHNPVIFHFPLFKNDTICLWFELFSANTTFSPKFQKHLFLWHVR